MTSTPAALALARVFARFATSYPVISRAVGIRKVPVCDEHGELSKLRFNPHSAIGVSRWSDFDARSMRVVRGDSAARERKKTKRALIWSRDSRDFWRNPLPSRTSFFSGKFQATQVSIE